LFRVYDGVALNYDQIQQNYISFLPEKAKKEDFYNKNDILKNGVISYERCQGKYNTLLLINPKGIRVPNITWKIDDPTGGEESDLWKSCGSTLFLNYADPAINS
jgi:hypothetical protein